MSSLGKQLIANERIDAAIGPVSPLEIGGRTGLEQRVWLGRQALAEPQLATQTGLRHHIIKPFISRIRNMLNEHGA